jgi:hypothetical protein
MARFSDFALDIRRIATRQALPGYCLAVTRAADRSDTLHFHPLSRGVPEAALLAAGGSAGDKQ